jgi:hypothetical protein
MNIHGLQIFFRGGGVRYIAFMGPGGGGIRRKPHFFPGGYPHPHPFRPSMVMNELKSYQFAFALSIGTIRRSRCAAFQHHTRHCCRRGCQRSYRSSDTFSQNHIRLRIARQQFGNTRGKPSYYTKCPLKKQQKSH